MGPGPHRMQRSSYMGPRDWIKKAIGFDYEFSYLIDVSFSFLFI